MKPSIEKRALAEAIGTSLLVAAVVGSGIMAERLSGGNDAIALLANTISTGAALAALILAFGPVSGAHLNPAVTICVAVRRIIPLREVPIYIAAQSGGAASGTILAHLMFSRGWYSFSTHQRSGPAQLFSEFVATFGLLLIIWGSMRLCSEMAPPVAVASYITAAYWFTASTSFANPAVTMARCITNSFSGIRPIDVPGFVISQIAGALSATALFAWLVPGETADIGSAGRRIKPI